jgi:hypothetical protein
MLQKKHSELMATQAKTKITIRELRTTKMELEHAYFKGQTELACAEGRCVKLAVQCRAVESEVAAAAGKSVTVNAQVKDFETRVAILTEVRCDHSSRSSCLMLYSRLSVCSHNVGITEWGRRTAGDEKGPGRGSCRPDRSEGGPRETTIARETPAAAER